MNKTLVKVSLRNIAAHKLRLVLTVLSVLLGTAFIAGSLVFTASLNKTFSSVVSTMYDGVDVVASANPNQGETITPEVREQIANTPGVARVNVDGNQKSIVMTDSAGDPIQTSGAPSYGLPYYPDDQVVGEAYTLIDGKAPEAPDEILINTTAARLGDLQIGDTTTVVSPTDRQEFRVSGINESPADASGVVTVAMPEQTWMEFFSGAGVGAGDSTAAGAGDAVGTGDDAAAPDVETVILSVDSPDDVQAVIDQLQSEFPYLQISSGEKLASDAAEEISQALDFVGYFLVAFGVIGLVVGIFLISNTFSMLVAQRTKEFALLRSLGTSRGQLTRSVLLEAGLVGLVGSVLGVLAGFGLTWVLFKALAAFEIELPNDGLTFTSQAIFVPIVVGLIITLLAAFAPAYRAGQIPPVEAMRSAGMETSAISSDGKRGGVLGVVRSRYAWGYLFVAISIGLLVAGVVWNDGSTQARASFVGFGSVLAILALWLVGPHLAKPVVGGLGRVIGAPFGMVGRLAATNSGRNPKRTATTAFALTLGLMLVVSVSMLGSSMKAAVDNWTENNNRADFFLMPPQGSMFQMPRAVADDVLALDDVSEIATQSIALGTVTRPETARQPVDVDSDANGDVAGSAGGGAMGGMTGPAFTATFDADWAYWFNTEPVAGSLDLAAEDAGAIISKGYSEAADLEVGDLLLWDSPIGQFDVPITGIQDALPERVTLSTGLVQLLVEEANAGNVPSGFLQPVALSIIATDGGDLNRLHGELDEIAAKYLVIQVMTPEEVAGVAANAVNAMLGVVYALLALAIVISILGIVNTLTLSTIERRTEIGMLRAVGLQRKQIRSMVRLEALQLAIFGALCGVGLGLAVGFCLLKALEDVGISTINVPFAEIVGVLVVSAIVGVLAAVSPARHAAKTPPLAALAE